MQVVDFPLQRFQEKPHQPAYLVPRPAPVFAAECEQRKAFDAPFGGNLDGCSNRLHAGTVAGMARLVTGARPAAVAIHNDGNMTG